MTVAIGTSGVPKLRMFAGPDGSGKTSLIHTLGREFSPAGFVSLHRLVNADDILTALESEGGLSLSSYGIKGSVADLKGRLVAIGRLSAEQIEATRLELKDHVLHVDTNAASSYFAAAMADIIRYDLLRRRESMTFETVMSHPSKAAFLAEARQAGYRTYLYFIATTRPQVNLDRVKNRIQLGGHSVPPEKITQRYQRSLEQLSFALRHADRGFIFDGSGRATRLLAELHPDRRIELKVPERELPAWYRKYMPTSLPG